MVVLKESGSSAQTSYLILGKVWPYGIDFGGWHWGWRLVEKIVCPIYWQQSLLGIKRNRFSFTENRRRAALAECLTVHLLRLSHCQTRRNCSRKQRAFRHDRRFTKEYHRKDTNWCSLLIWQWTIRANITSLSLFLLKEHSTTSTYILAFQI